MRQKRSRYDAECDRVRGSPRVQMHPWRDLVCKHGGRSLRNVRCSGCRTRVIGTLGRPINASMRPNIDSQGHQCSLILGEVNHCPEMYMNTIQYVYRPASCQDMPEHSRRRDRAVRPRQACIVRRALLKNALSICLVTSCPVHAISCWIPVPRSGAGACRLCNASGRKVAHSLCTARARKVVR